MMEFALSEEQRAVQETARRFARERLMPGYLARDNVNTVPQELRHAMGQLGLIGADLPEACGGLGQDFVTAGLIIEEIAYADFNAAYIQLLGSLNGQLIAANATNPEVLAACRGITTGDTIVALGLTEPRGGSDAAHLVTKAQLDGDHYVISGEKTSISMINQANGIVLFARSNPEEPGARGVSAFYVPLPAKGVTITTFEDVGSTSVGRGSIFFDAVAIPQSYRLGAEGAGFRQVMAGFDYTRALIGLQCLAAARASLDETWDYVQQRQAFGNPLARYQGVTEPLAEAETLLSAARLLCLETLWRRDAGLAHTKEAAMVKWWAPKTAFEVIHRCLLTHGHGGYSKDLPHQQRLRDVMGLQIGDGTEQIQKMIVAREMIGRVAVPY